MQTTLILHIIAGGVGLLSGFVALYATKGTPLHRRAGMVFVYAMLAMCAAGTLIAAVRNAQPDINIPAALLTAYLVITGLTTVRQSSTPRWFSIGALLVAAAVALTALSFGFDAVAKGGSRNGMPAFPYFMFGVVGLLASIGDIRVLLAGPLTGTRRITRHLWRISFALFVAAMSFFIGQSDEFPEAVRIVPLLATPPLAVLLTMFFWMWRVRGRRSLKGFTMTAPQPARPLPGPGGPAIHQAHLSN